MLCYVTVLIYKVR